jgi:lysophospholipase L1-like esterase
VKVLVFGSSIAEGYLATRGGWVQQLINDVAPFGIDHGQGGGEVDWIMNLGVAGDTTGKVLARFEAETQARIGPPDAALGVVFAVGANDSMKVGDHYLSTPAQFTDNLAALHGLARRRTDHIMFVDFTAMDPDGPGTRQFFDPVRVAHAVEVAGQAADVAVARVTAGRPSK